MKYNAGQLRLRRFNDALTVVLIALALYIVVAPFLPQVSFWIQEESPVKALTSKSEDVQSKADSGVVGNMLFIPELGLSEIVHEGGVEKLKSGVVRRSHTSTPDSGSNTVFVGHRFMYDVRGVFYHLDKVEEGNEIIVHWDSKKYTYQVVSISVVSPDQISIEGKTDEEVLTLYTCTPLWSAKDRLVVRATLMEVE